MSVVLFYVLIVFGVQTTLDLLERKAFLGLLLFELALVLILTLGIAISTLIETMHDFAKLAGQIKVFCKSPNVFAVPTTIVIPTLDG